jgi:hypothetical protein
LFIRAGRAALLFIRAGRAALLFIRAGRAALLFVRAGRAALLFVRAALLFVRAALLFVRAGRATLLFVRAEGAALLFVRAEGAALLLTLAFVDFFAELRFSFFAELRFLVGLLLFIEFAFLVLGEPPNADMIPPKKPVSSSLSFSAWMIRFLDIITGSATFSFFNFCLISSMRSSFFFPSTLTSTLRAIL